eukprot:TRINITY_DN24969_c0_g1_i1.p1 TRINITY_DN24969_c0_g1~~TRINITY_DN24969_c0_g1_i1.p1  ORF type:complete len:181 (-),score=46.92 TRINITY_DN24969_c0_g1_i1:42-584(-)
MSALLPRIEALRTKYYEIEAAVLKSTIRPQNLPNWSAEIKKATEIKLSDNDEIKVDWERYEKLSPFHYKAILALKKFQDSCEATFAKNYTDGCSNTVQSAIIEKLNEMEADAAYFERPLTRIEDDLALKKELLKEKQRFLIEEKVSTLLDEHPQWAQQIVEDINNMDWDNPLLGTVLEEE